MMLVYDDKRLISDIRQTPMRRKYRNAYLALAKALRSHYVVPTHGGHGGGQYPGDKGSTCLYWDIGLYYCDIEVNPSGRTYSVYIKQRKDDNDIRGERDWWFESVTLAEFEEPWLVRLLGAFRKVQHV